MQATARMASVVSSTPPARRRLIRSVRPTPMPAPMPNESELVIQLRQAASNGAMLWLHWQWLCLDDLESLTVAELRYPRGSIDCLPLWVGDQLMTVCEIDSSLRFNRIVVLRLAAIFERPLPRHPRSEFLQWALHKHAQAVPKRFPTTDSFEGVLTEALHLNQPVTLVDSKGLRRTTALLRVSDGVATFQYIDCCGYFCWPERLRLADLIMVEIGGVLETRLLEHAQLSPNCYDSNKDTI